MALSTAVPAVGPHSVEEWLDAEAPADGSRLELLEGFWLVTTSPGLPHQNGSHELCQVLREALVTAGRDDLVAVPAMGVILSPRNGLIPDIMICPRQLDGRVVDRGELILAIELWSPSNRPGEKTTKRAAFETAEVPFWWEVDIDDHGPVMVRTYRLAAGAYRPAEVITAQDGPVPVRASPVPVTVDVSRLRL